MGHLVRDTLGDRGGQLVVNVDGLPALQRRVQAVARPPQRGGDGGLQGDGVGRGGLQPQPRADVLHDEIAATGQQRGQAGEHRALDGGDRVGDGHGRVGAGGGVGRQGGAGN
ncbi:hypothetical protein AZA_56447 [Nitrospirillum viridazoti Y2]|nr:hypothetical protein AZA_56447 [Nitrospirillum amazonense Y2]